MRWLARRGGSVPSGRRPPAAGSVPGPSGANDRQAPAAPLGEEGAVVPDAEVLAGQLAEDRAEVGGHRQVAPFVEGVGVDAGKMAVHLAAVDAVAEHEQA